METITLIADRDAKSPVAEAYRTIRTNIQFSNVGQELKTIIVTRALRQTKVKVQRSAIWRW